MLRKLVALTALSIAMAGCEEVQSDNAKAKVEVSKAPVSLEFKSDLSSPDNALKTWWAYLDARLAHEHAAYVDYYSTISNESEYKKISTGKVFDAISAANKDSIKKDVYLREILEVKVETDTRAIAFAKITNITPTEVIPTEEEKKTREKGGRYKYLIEKVEGEWKVSQVYNYWEFAEKWHPQYDVQPESYPKDIFGKQ